MRLRISQWWIRKLRCCWTNSISILPIWVQVWRWWSLCYNWLTNYLRIWIRNWWSRGLLASHCCNWITTTLSKWIHFRWWRKLSSYCFKWSNMRRWIHIFKWRMCLDLRLKSHPITNSLWYRSTSYNSYLALNTNMPIRFRYRWIRKLRRWLYSNWLCIRICNWWKWKLSLNYYRITTTSNSLSKWIKEWWKWKLSRRKCKYLMCRWMGNRRIRWMSSIDHRFTNNRWISNMPRQSCFRRKRRMYPTRYSNRMRSWLLEWRKRKLHLNANSSAPNPIIISKCLPMPRCNWWIIIRNLSFASCHCSSTTLTYWIISNLGRTRFSIKWRCRNSSQSYRQCQETSST